MTSTITSGRMERYHMQESHGRVREAVEDAVEELAAGHCRTEWDGIGPYEFWGQRCNDRGRERVEFDGFTLAILLNRRLRACVGLLDVDADAGEMFGTEFGGKLPDEARGCHERWAATFDRMMFDAAGAWAVYEVTGD